MRCAEAKPLEGMIKQREILSREVMRRHGLPWPVLVWCILVWCNLALVLPDCGKHKKEFPSAVVYQRAWLLCDMPNSLKHNSLKVALFEGRDERRSEVSQSNDFAKRGNKAGMRSNDAMGSTADGEIHF